MRQSCLLTVASKRCVAQRLRPFGAKNYLIVIQSTASDQTTTIRCVFVRSFIFPNSIVLFVCMVCSKSMTFVVSTELQFVAVLQKPISLKFDYKDAVLLFPNLFHVCCSTNPSEEEEKNQPNSFSKRFFEANFQSESL